MSMNIPPHIPQVVANSAIPAAESLAKANAVREVVPPTTQAEAIVPQKSREQDVRPPINQPTPSTYEDIQSRRSNTDIIPEGEQESQDDSNSEQQQNSSGSNEEQASQAQSGQSDAEAKAEKQAEREDAEQKQQAQVEQQQIQELQQRDNEVRAHEQAHAAIGGTYAGSPQYEYETGPNGKKYAVGGEVSIDVSKAATPEETIRKMQTVQAAALAPAEPSAQDRKVAAQASRQIADARAEVIVESAQGADSKADSTKVESSFEENGETESTDSVEVDAVSASSGASQVATENTNEAKATSGTSAEIDIELPNQMSLAQPQGAAEQDESPTPFESKTAQVISNRYASAVKPYEPGFSAVA